MNDLTLTAVVFAGGLSTRMGRDKALLEIQGEPLWSRQLNLLRQLRPQQLAVSARSRPSWAPAEVTVFLDEPPSCGPLSGLTASLEGMTGSHLLVLAVDLPRMSAPFLERLWFRARPGCGIVSDNAGQLEPLCAVYPREALTFARRSIAANQFSLQQLARALHSEGRLDILEVSKPEQGLFLNANTVSDLAGL